MSKVKIVVSVLLFAIQCQQVKEELNEEGPLTEAQRTRRGRRGEEKGCCTMDSR